jgi:hypothetical protein
MTQKQTTISASAESQRESARATDGRFGAQQHAESSLTLGATEPAAKPARKVTSKGVTTMVTLPDGSVDTRTSLKGNYTHAVVRGPEKPELVIANREAAIRHAEETIKDIKEAYVEPKHKIRNRGFSRHGEDPDLNYQGKPSYHGFEVHLLKADGRTSLYSVHSNSKGLHQGIYDHETGKYDGEATQLASLAIRDSLKDLKKRSEEAIARAQEDIDSVKAGTYQFGGPFVARWSSRQDLAEKAMNSKDLRHDHPTREMWVVPVDE